MILRVLSSIAVLLMMRAEYPDYEEREELAEHDERVEQVGVLRVELFEIIVAVRREGAI